jgi:hypothetical protein
VFTLDVMAVPQGSGSGFIWDKKGHIVTNYHVIRGASDLRYVRLPSSSSSSSSSTTSSSCSSLPISIILQSPIVLLHHCPLPSFYEFMVVLLHHCPFPIFYKLLIVLLIAANLLQGLHNVPQSLIFQGFSGDSWQIFHISPMSCVCTISLIAFL